MRLPWKDAFFLVVVVAGSLTVASARNTAAQDVPVDDGGVDLEVVDPAEDSLRWFDATIFRDRANRIVLFDDDDSNPATRGRTWLEARLTLLLEDVVRTDEMTAEERERLALAGLGDIDRFMSRYSEARERIRVAAAAGNQNIWGDGFKEANALQRAFRSEVFGPRSLFAKTLRRVLTPEQVARHEEAENERRLYARGAAIAVAVALLEERIPLRAEKRERLVRLLEEQLPTSDTEEETAGAVLRQVSKLPKTSLKEVFDEVQLRNLAPNLEQLGRIHAMFE